MIIQVADPLKNAANRYEDLRKSQADFAAKLERERDGSYGELKKIKGKYDGTCQEVENRRKKTESSFDYGKNKAQAAYQQQVSEMHNVKASHVVFTKYLALIEIEYIPYYNQYYEQAQREILS